MSNGHQSMMKAALGVLSTVLALSSAAAAATPHAAAHCRSFTAGTAVYTNVRVVDVTCPFAAHLLSQTMLRTIRLGRMWWTYGGFRWWLLPTDGTIIGTSGTKLITAHL
jgi:hypothetical protein